MNVLMISPGYPAEMPDFTRGLAEAGATVIGLGDQHEAALPEKTRQHLTHYMRATSLWDEPTTVNEVVNAVRNGLRIDLVECLWEPGMVLAARIREALGLPGLTVEKTLPFRDKELMKQALDRAGIRTPRHHRASTEDQVRAAANDIGFPIIVKPIDGAGSNDTYRINDADELEATLPRLRGVDEVSVEEFVDAEEFTYDTICIDGEIVYENICWYRPRPLITKQNEWVCPTTVALRDLSPEELQGGRQMGRDVIKALGFESGFTHMEWYRKADGEVVFGEIGARPPGAHTVDVMNFASDIDTYKGWAEAVAFKRFTQSTDRIYNAATVFKRAKGQGRIARIEGMDSFMGRHGSNVVACDMLPIGAPRRDWQATIVSDAGIVVRHPSLETTLEIANEFAAGVQLYAG